MASIFLRNKADEQPFCGVYMWRRRNKHNFKGCFQLFLLCQERPTMGCRPLPWEKRVMESEQRVRMGRAETHRYMAAFWLQYLLKMQPLHCKRGELKCCTLKTKYIILYLYNTISCQAVFYCWHYYRHPPFCPFLPPSAHLHPTLPSAPAFTTLLSRLNFASK